MSTIPESNYKLEGNKMLVSLTLKIPLQFEIELQGMQDTKVTQVNYEQSLNSAKNTNSDLIINEINQTEIEKKAQILSNQLASQILDSHSQILSHINQSNFTSENPGDREKNFSKLPENNSLNTSSPSENLGDREENLETLPENNSLDSLNTSLYSEDKPQSDRELIFNTRKKRKGRFADLLNDSLTLVANLIGTMLFLGKLANYSWE